jgi:hypothetical protein
MFLLCTYVCVLSVWNTWSALSNSSRIPRGDLRGSSFFGEVWLGFTYLLSLSPISVATVTIAIDIPSAMVSSLNNGLSIVVVVAVGI